MAKGVVVKPETFKISQRWLDGEYYRHGTSARFSHALVTEVKRLGYEPSTASAIEAPDGGLLVTAEPLPCYDHSDMD